MRGEQKKSNVGVCASFVVVLASFRGTVQYGLPLEIGDTVQILEKCEGMVHIIHFLCACCIQISCLF